MQTENTPYIKPLRWFVIIAMLAAISVWFYISPEGALGKLDAVGYAICHRIDARSFQIGERQLPLCARCTGEFNAAAISFIVLGWMSGKRSKFPKRSILVLLFLFFLAFGIDGSNSYLYLLKQTSQGALDNIPNLYIPNSILRIFTGSGMGIALAAILYPAVNQTIWRNSEQIEALDWKILGIIIGIVSAMNLAVLADSTIMLYLIAYLSIFGILVLLSAVFSMAWIMIMRQENTFDHPRQLWLAAASGLTLGLILIISIDLFRLQLTGTWGGFPGITG